MRLENTSRKISSRGLRSPMKRSMAMRACGILRRMLPELSTMIPTDTGVSRSRQELNGPLDAVDVNAEVALLHVSDVATALVGHRHDNLLTARLAAGHAVGRLQLPSWVPDQLRYGQ